MNVAEAADTLARDGESSAPSNTVGCVRCGFEGEHSDAACKQRRYRLRKGSHGLNGAHPETALSWSAVDLREMFENPTPPVAPAILARDGGVRLIYPGMTHTAFGETESLKTWLALIAVTQEIQAGNHVVYIDYESDARIVVQRRLHELLRVPADDLIERLRYVQASDPVSVEALAALVAPPVPSLCVIDGLTEAMALQGLNPNDGVDVARFYALLPRQITQSGCAVLTLDHVVKDREGRGLYPVNSAHKLNAIDGAAYSLELVAAPSAEHAGSARVYVAKDRHGEVRRHALGKQIATLHIEANATGWRLDGPSTSGNRTNGEFQPTVLMGRVSKYLAAQGAPVSQSHVVREIRGKQDYVREALRCLVRDGYALQTDGPRNALLIEHVKLFEDGS